jgi:hypothetical protein
MTLFSTDKAHVRFFYVLALASFEESPFSIFEFS